MTNAYRTVNRQIAFDIAISGEVTWQYPDEGSRTVLVEEIRVRFDADDHGDAAVTVYVRGPYLRRDGRPGVTRADDYVGRREGWPEWIERIVRAHQPDAYSPCSGSIETQ